MRSKHLLFALVAFCGSSAALSQSICNPCVDPPIRIERPEFLSPGETRVITAAEMMELGVISVADMINQLPNGLEALVPDGESEVESDEATEVDESSQTDSDSGESNSSEE